MAKGKATHEPPGGEMERIDVHTHSRPHHDPARYRGSGSAYVKRIRKQGVHAVVLLAPGEGCRCTA